MQTMFVVSGLLTIFTVFLRFKADAGGCDDDSVEGGFIFPRVFYAMYSGPSAPIADMDSVAWALGNCHSVDGYLEDVYKYFEPFGLDLRSTRTDPSVVIDNPRFHYAGYVLDPKENYRIVSETFYNYAKHLDSQLIHTSHMLTAKTDIHGPGRSMPAGHHAMYGISRFKTHGRYFCVEAWNREPTRGFYSPNSLVPIDLAAYSKHWGEGALRGVIKPVNTLNTTRFDISWAMSFPADP